MLLTTTSWHLDNLKSGSTTSSVEGNGSERAGKTMMFSRVLGNCISSDLGQVTVSVALSYVTHIAQVRMSCDYNV